MTSGRACILAAIGVLFFFCAPVGAQQFEISTDFQVAQPIGEFADHLDATGLGLNIRVGYTPQHNGIFSIGGELSWAAYGWRDWSEHHGGDHHWEFDDRETTNNILLAHAVFRAQQPRGKVRVYGEALVGASYFFTQTGFQDCGDDCDSVIEFDDTALSYGGGAGLLLIPWGVGPRGYPPAAEVGFDVGVRYLHGGTAYYLKEGSGDLDQPYVVETSSTDMVLPHFGLVVRF